MSSSLRDRLSKYLVIAARLAFALTIVLIPLRWRVDVWQRPFFPVYSEYTNFLLFASDMAMLYMLVFWVCSLLLAPRRLKTGSVWIWICLAGVAIAGWVSVFASQDPMLSSYHAVRFVVLLLFYLFIVNEIYSPVWVIAPVALQIIIQSMIAIGQSLAQSSLGLHPLGEHLLDPARSGASVVIGNGFRFLRAYGLSDHPNILGGCIAFGLVLLLAVVLYGKDRHPLLASILFMVSFLALVMTFSRSAWLSLMVAGSFMVACEALARRWDSVKRAILLGVLSLLLVAPFFMKNDFVFRTRLNSGNISQDDPMKERTFLMNAGNTLFVEHSAVGVGLGVSPLAMKNRFEYFPLNFQPPHYAILVAAMETGVVGGVFYFLLLILPVIAFAARWRVYIHQPLVMAAFSLLIALMVVGFFDYYTWMYAPGRLWQWLGWGLFSKAWKEAA